MNAVRHHAILVGGTSAESGRWIQYGLELAGACGADPILFPSGIHGAITPPPFADGKECFLLAELPPAEAKLQRLVGIPADGKMDLLLSRGIPGSRYGGIVVASGGGTRALKAIDLAGRLGKAWNIQVRVLRIVRPLAQLPAGSPAWEQYLDEIRSAMTLQCKLQGVDASIDLVIGDSVPQSIADNLSANELLLMGGPSDWRLVQHAEGAIPYEVLEAVSNSTLLLIPAQTKEIGLAEVYWEDTIRLNLFPRDKWEAISLLVDALVEERQIPVNLAATVCAAAAERESIQPTAVGCEVAVPHAALPGFSSIVGCLGVFPDGVPFSGRDVERVRFAFLLITPREDYGQYLVVLSQLARLMHKESNRAALLESKTPKAASELIARNGITAQTETN